MLSDRVQGEPQVKDRTDSAHNSIQQLPIEVASHIFGLCLAPLTLHGTAQLNRQEGRSFQFQLGAVCQRWRQIVWANPCFWRHISLQLSETTPLAITSFVQEWLVRSGELPLAIELVYNHSETTNQQYSDHSDLDRTGYSQPLLQAIQMVAHRWRWIHLEVPPPYLSVLHCRTSQPHFLSLYIQPSRYPSQGAFDLGSKSGPERLEVHNISKKDLHIRWDNLTHFHQGGFKASESLDVLRSAPRLTSITLWNIFDLRPCKPPVTHSSVQKIHLRLLGGNSKALWKSLSLPSLKELHLVAGYIFPLDTASEFLHRSQCYLRKATFSFPTVEVVKFLRLAPSLEDLVWVWGREEGDEALFEALGGEVIEEPTNTKTPFLPLLSNLRIDTVKLFSWPLLASIAPRIGCSTDTSIRPLKRIQIALGKRTKHTMPEIEADNLRNILELIDGGVDITICNDKHHDLLGQWIKYYGSKGDEFEWLKTYQSRKLVTRSF